MFATLEKLLKEWEGYVGVPELVDTTLEMYGINDWSKKDNEVDAQDNPLANIFQFGIHQHHRYITLSGHFLGFVTVLCHRQSYESWGSETQEAVHKAIAQATEAQRGFALAEDDRVLAELEKTDNEVIELSAGERRLFVEAVQPVIDTQLNSLDSRLVDLYLGTSA